MKYSKIISFDGTSPSGGFGYVSAGLLAEIQTRISAIKPEVGVLDNVEAFVGNSAGSWNALYLASQKDPSAGLAGIVDFWTELNQALSKMVSVVGGVGALAGAGSLLQSKPLCGFFCDYFGSRTKLGDLPHPVMITAFQLDAPDATPRSWRARVFDSGDPDGNDAEELVADIAIRSSSPPVLEPIFQSITGKGPGYVDGGVFANNPSLVAYTQMLHRRKLGKTAFDDVLLLSCGNGEVPRYLAPRYRDGEASWGYSQWLLDLCKPLVAIDMMIEASMMLTSFQCEQIMGDDYHRLDPFLGDGVHSFAMNNALAKILAEPSTQLQLDATVAWMHESGWLEA
ncbi:patatin-like phospholipase family protein [Enhygromyxa salina]|uniref:Putative sporulation hydrolase CotR n=1 Tax=Enhygromyxa salina TaxID=215803 RepID=A0A2S9YN22_9BACT|nr:patatin-like phospholipase family protein [Enhygromyxa salina]PRQ06475.1 putative sporulation hydrolase CotR [Enhygromyxa salina]